MQTTQCRTLQACDIFKKLFANILRFILKHFLHDCALLEDRTYVVTFRLNKNKAKYLQKVFENVLFFT